LGGGIETRKDFFPKRTGALKNYSGVGKKAGRGRLGGGKGELNGFGGGEKEGGRRNT